MHTTVCWYAFRSIDVHLCGCWLNNSRLSFDGGAPSQLLRIRIFPDAADLCRFQFVCLRICLLWVVVDFRATCWWRPLWESIGWRSVCQSAVGPDRPEVKLTVEWLQNSVKKTHNKRGNATNWELETHFSSPLLLVWKTVNKHNLLIARSVIKYLQLFFCLNIWQIFIKTVLHCDKWQRLKGYLWSKVPKTMGLNAFIEFSIKKLQ